VCGLVHTVYSVHTDIFTHVQRSIQTPLLIKKINSPKELLTELRLLFVGSQIVI